MRLLEMDFQPIFMAGLSLKKVDRSHWAVVQKRVVPMKRPSCSLCGFIAETKRSLIQADEVWIFSSPTRVLLADVRPLCADCHDAKDYADLLRRIVNGKASASRATKVLEHYCDKNACSKLDFDNDFKAAMQKKQEKERLYGWNVKADVVDYGRWDRPPQTPRLSDAQKRLVKSLYRDRDEPIVVGDKSLATYGLAVRYLQSLQLDSRTKVIAEMTDAVNEEREDDDFLTEIDEGVQFS